MKLRKFGSPLVTLAVALGLVAVPASAGVTGVPGINDYTINGGGSGTTSCNTLTFTSPTTLTFSVSTTPGLPVAFAFSACACAADSLFLPPIACLLPFTSFTATTNQSFDLNPTCPLTIPLAFSDASGVASFSVPVPLLSATITLGTQAAVLGLPCAAPQSFALTQAYTLVIN